MKNPCDLKLVNKMGDDKYNGIYNMVQITSWYVLNVMCSVCVNVFYIIKNSTLEREKLGHCCLTQRTYEMELKKREEYINIRKNLPELA